MKKIFITALFILLCGLSFAENTIDLNKLIGKKLTIESLVLGTKAGPHIIYENKMIYLDGSFPSDLRGSKVKVTGILTKEYRKFSIEALEEKSKNGPIPLEEADGEVFTLKELKWEVIAKDIIKDRDQQIIRPAYK